MPLLCAPGITIIKLEPMTFHLAQNQILRRLPMDIKIMTEAMPMTMPSMVKIERIFPCVRLRVAVLKASLKSINYFKFSLRTIRLATIFLSLSTIPSFILIMRLANSAVCVSCVTKITRATFMVQEIPVFPSLANRIANQGCRSVRRQK